MDFITGLPSSHGHTSILVVVDRFSKAIHFATLPPQFSTYQVATIFFEVVGKLHGMPKSIVSDRDPLFLSKFWQELFKASGTQLRMSSAYYPDSDEQSETPFEIAYGRSPPSLSGYILGQSQVEAVDHLLSSRDNILSTLRRNLQKAQDHMKAMADVHRRDVEYEVGAWVYVKLKPYRQTLLAGKTPQKLAKRYFGPFQILSQIGPVAYRLSLPETSKIHPVFHCSVLKPHHGPPPSVAGTLLSNHYKNGPLVNPLVILGTRENNSSDSPHLEVLVQWQGLSPEEATWESWMDIQRTFNLEDKVLLQGAGNDTINIQEDIGSEGSESSGTECKNDDDNSESKRRKFEQKLGSSIMRSASELAQALRSCEEKKEKRHQEMMELHRRGLHIEETRNQANQQGITNLVSAVTNLTGVIQSLVTMNKDHGGENGDDHACSS
ncbi:hypothetical protein V8G54_017823 [Vigna mungo]|uniref:Uncharacterized protein n=1 Tax=Vigna mungo TaxID=3915 RepID=A0AAQ3S1R0_VIGMU